MFRIKYQKCGIIIGAKRPADPVGWRRAGNEQMTVLPKAKKSSVNAVARQSEGRAFDSTPSYAAGFHTQYERREARHLKMLSRTDGQPLHFHGELKQGISNQQIDKINRSQPIDLMLWTVKPKQQENDRP